MKRKSLNKILFVGDSLVAGYGVDSKENWVFLVGQTLQLNSCINKGYNGFLSSQVKEVLKESLDEESFDIVGILCGANDFIQGYSVEDLFKTLKDMEGMIENSGGKSIFILPPLPDFEEEDPFVSMATFVSLENKILELETRIGKGALPLSQVLPRNKNLFFDGLHPTEEGHRLIAESVIEFLEEKGLSY